MSESQPAPTDQRPFADYMSISGRVIEMPTWSDFLTLESELKKGAVLPFSLQRQSDRDASLDINASDSAFAIVGMEDSKQRGTYGFCYLDLTKTSKLIVASGEYYPEYCTTDDVSVVVQIARKYFQTGDLDRSVTWHVARQGLGGKKEDIPQTEILLANDDKVTLETLLSRL